MTFARAFRLARCGGWRVRLAVLLLPGMGWVGVYADDVAPAAVADVLAPMVISAPRYKAPMTALERFKFDLFMRLNLENFGWPRMDGAFVLTPERVPQSARKAVFAVDVFESERLRALAIGSLLNGLQTSLDGGVCEVSRIRGGRVLLDGVPVNDAFDGTVPWNELPREGLARVEIVPGGGATGWGETGGGVGQLFTRPALGKIVTEPSPPPKDDPDLPLPPRRIVRRTGVLAAGAGDRGERGLELAHTEPTRAGMIQLLGGWSQTDGFVAIAPEWRGAADTASGRRNHWLAVRWRRPLGRKVEITVTAKGAEASRGLGTRDQQAHERSQFASVALAGKTAEGLAWNGVAYLERRGSDRRFGAVSRGRSDETPVLAEFAEPVTSWGASWTGAWHYPGDARTNFGVDMRFVRGETRAAAGWTNGAFARELVAGGEQAIAGIFLLHQHALAQRWRGTAGLRIDGWSEADGRERETERASGAVLRDERRSGRRGAEFSPTAGLVWEPRRSWHVRAAMQGSFRRPTLAERYRWWGERNTLIAPNPALKTEHSQNAEITVEYSPKKSLAIVARGFATTLRNSAGTRAATRGAEAGENSLVDDLPDAVELRRRIALDRVRIVGGEISVRRNVSPQLTVEASVRRQETKIGDSAELPPAAARELPYSPRLSAAMGVTWRVVPKIELSAQVRGRGRAVADEENTRHVGEAVVMDAAATYVLDPRAEFFLKVRNVGAARVEAERGAGRVVYLDESRTFFAGLRIAW